MEPELPAATPHPLREVAAVFLRLGVTAFGGPAAHIAMMEAEIVRRRRWLSHEKFLDLLGATNLIPGPNSTEMAIHLGYLRAGWAGLVVAGACFIVPAASIVLLLAWAYVRYGRFPIALGVLDGVKPVMIAVVAQALWNLGKTAVKGWWGALVGLAVLALYILGGNELALLFGGGVVFAAAKLLREKPPRVKGVSPGILGALTAQAIAQAGRASGGKLFLLFLKIGGTLYGSGYVLLAFLRNDFVERTHWMTNQQLLDAIAVGQVTPGPVFTTATFVGYVVAGTPGAVLATLGIFLPSFVFVAAMGPLIPRLRAWPWTAALLDGVNVAALGLMAGVTIELARATFVRNHAPDFVAVAMSVVAVVLLVRWKVNSTWLIAGGAAIGAVLHWMHLGG